MSQKYFDDTFNEDIILPNNFSVHGNFLTAMAEAIPYPTHVKEMETKKYVMSNKANLEFLHFESENQIIGFTFGDLTSSIHPFWKNYIKIIDDLDNKVKAEKKLVQDTRFIIKPSGLITMHNLFKIPVLSALKKPIAIFTFSFDTTEKQNLFYLFSLYKKFYSTKKMAIDYFLKYLKIDTYFDSQPTDAEILVLLAMRDNPAHKIIGNTLKIQIKTVEIHTSNLRKKLKNKNLSCILAELRNIRSIL